MALSITQTPASASLAQSPIIFTVSESNPIALTSSSFQYVGDLWYWTGSANASSSTSDYTIVKFPNSAGVGIFDLNRIINSTLQSLVQENTSSISNFKVDFYEQWMSGSTFVTSSHVSSSTYWALDGYGIFPETIGQSIQSLTPFWPFMTDGPSTQSVLAENTGRISVMNQIDINKAFSKIRYTSSNGQTVLQTAGSPSEPYNTNLFVYSFPAYPSQTGFPLSGSYDWYKIQLLNVSEDEICTPIKYELVCNQKYPNVRIKWKNRFGQFDRMNFNMISRESFETTKRTYQPQLGSWESSTFGYNTYDSATRNYINDSNQMISVNSDWLQQDYNDILKQLLVSDEIYWVTDEATDTCKPLTIQTSNIVFKTSVVDKLIQYQFEFKYGQPYKLIM